MNRRERLSREAADLAQSTDRPTDRLYPSHLSAPRPWTPVGSVVIDGVTVVPGKTRGRVTVNEPGAVTKCIDPDCQVCADLAADNPAAPYTQDDEQAAHEMADRRADAWRRTNAELVQSALQKLTVAEYGALRLAVLREAVTAPAPQGS